MPIPETKPEAFLRHSDVDTLYTSETSRTHNNLPFVGILHNSGLFKDKIAI